MVRFVLDAGMDVIFTKNLEANFCLLKDTLDTL